MNYQIFFTTAISVLLLFTSAGFAQGSDRTGQSNNNDVTVNSITSTDGTEISFEKTGDGEPVVLVHGTGGNHKFWETTGVTQALKEEYSIYTVERRGRGLSGDTQSYELELEAIDIAAVIESIDEPVTLIGHSYGALCALETALQTDNIHTLILYEPPFTEENGYPPLEELVNVIKPMIEDGEDEQAMIIALSAVGLPQSHLDEYQATPEWQGVVDTAPTLPREYEEIIGYDFDASRFEEINIPTLLLYGTESPQRLKDASKTIEDALPNSNMISLEGAAHFAMITDTGHFIEKLLETIPSHDH